MATDAPSPKLKDDKELTDEEKKKKKAEERRRTLKEIFAIKGTSRLFSL